MTPPSFVTTSDVCGCVSMGVGVGGYVVLVCTLCVHMRVRVVCVCMHVCVLRARKSLYWHDACMLRVSSVSPFHTCALVGSSLTTASTADEKEDILSQNVAGELVSFVTYKGGMCL